MKKEITRREFFKSSAIIGAGSVGLTQADINKALAQKLTGGRVIPKRPFGRTGVDVPILGMGGSHNLMSLGILLKLAVKMGVTYWDTAHDYEGGNSEKAIGKYFSRYPNDRKKIFLVTKSKSNDPGMLTNSLNKSLERLKTSYVDLFFIHQASDVKRRLTNDVRKWAENAKKRGKIRYFGFSVHKNMADSLLRGAKLGWVNGIMTTYNYRLMNDDNMQRAIDACQKAGIGLTAMKTQAPFFPRLWADIGNEDDEDYKLMIHFVKKGFTTEQAKLKAVWESTAIASICSEMTNMAILQANVASALNKTKLSQEDRVLLRRFANQTASGYCMGCAEKCESVLGNSIPIADIIRSLMYYLCYGDRSKGVRQFNRIPLGSLQEIVRVDFSEAEQQCPQKLPIGKLISQACSELIS